jgi:protocatechuate 3,4-dioxygenase beta subunit
MRDAARGTPVVGIVLGIVVLGLAALGVFLGIGRPRAAVTNERAPVAAAESEESLDAAPDAIEEAHATSERAPAPPATAPEPAEAEPDAEPPANELRGRVVDAAGAPLPGAHIALERGIAREFNVLDLEAAHASERIAEATADERGEFRFVLARGIPVDLVASGTGFVDTLVPDRYAGEYVEVTLTPGFLAHGRVTRARDGSPVEGAAVRVFRLGGPSSLARRTTSDADGRYELRFTFRESAMIEVVSANEQSSDWLDLVVGPDGSVEKDVVLEPGIVVEGRVTDAESGEPIQGAVVGEGWVYRRKAVTNALGEYRLPGFGQPGSAELYAKAQGYGEVSPGSLPGAENGVMHVDFELPPGRAVTGRILDPGGSPIAGAYVAAVATEFTPDGQASDWCSGTTDEGGRFRIESLTPGLAHALFARKHGWSTHVWDFPERAFFEREVELGDLVLTPPALIAGHVEDESGAPLPDVEVSLGGANADRFRLSEGRDLSPPDGFLDSYVASRDVRSNARGRFSFGGVAAGSYTLQARKRGWADADPLALVVEEGRDQEDLVLRLAGGVSIRGRVVDEDGRPVRKAYVRPEAVALDPPETLGVSVPSAESDADGQFELLGLPEGEYRIDVYPFYVAEWDPEAPWLMTTLESVRTGAEELEVVLEKGANVAGVLLDAEGKPLFDHQVSPVDVRTTGALVTTDVEGRFSLAVPRGATCDLEVRAPFGERDRIANEVLLTRQGVTADTTDLVLQLAK